MTCPTLLPAGHRIPAGLTYSTVRPDLDFETYSEAGKVINLKDNKVTGKGLSEVGTAVYAEHPTADILCFSYDLKDGKGKRRWFPGCPDPVDLLDHIAAGGDIAAHNATFEWYVWNMICFRKYGWPPLQFAQLHCDMAKARRHALPAALGKLCEVLGTSDKDKRGQQLIRDLCMPSKKTANKPYFRRTPATDWDKFEELYNYCDQDIHSEACAAALVPDLTPYERQAWLNDQYINARGVQLDVPSLDACLRVLEDATVMYTAELVQITGGQVNTVNETAKFVAWCQANDANIPNLQAETVEEWMKRETLQPSRYRTIEEQTSGAIQPHVKRALEIRSILGGANVKKLHTYKRMASSDGRLRNQYTYCTAHTGRSGANGAQLQNITGKGPKVQACDDCGHIAGLNHVFESMGHPGACPCCGSINSTKRPEWDVEAVEYALADIRAYNGGLLALVAKWGDPAALLAGCLRGLLIAKQDHELVCCDFSAIEAVVLACLSRCQWRIEVFSTHGKIYEKGASEITGTPFAEMMAHAGYTDLSIPNWWEAEQTGEHHGDRKKIGKVSELACFTRDTQVLTKRGYVRIVEVTKHDYLWDGVEWVTSDGVIAKGTKDTMLLDGVRLTPDHPVSLNGSWTEAKKLASNPSMLSQALATGSANLPSCATRSKGDTEGQSVSVLAGAKNSTIWQTYTAISLHGALSAAARKAATHTSSFTQNMLTSCQTLNTADDWSTGCAQLSQGAPVKTTSSTTTTAGEVLQSVTNGEDQTEQERSCSTFSLSKGGTFPHWKWTGSKLTETMSRAISALSPDEITCSISAAYLKCKSESTTLNDVYDIVNAGPRHRFTIKTDSGHMIVHNSGYGGWIGAWAAFGADKFMNEDEIKAAILAWRAASPEIVEFWGGQHRQIGPKPWDSKPELFGLEGMFVKAVQNPGQCFHHIDLSFAMYGDVLYIRLPSGRFLHYHKPRLTAGVDHFRRPSQNITFMGWNSNSQKGRVGWTSMETYGGRLAENVTQAVAADIQFESIGRLQDRGIPVVMHTHDENSAEVPVGSFTVEESVAVMTERPSWASWWPIRADGWHGKRFRK